MKRDRVNPDSSYKPNFLDSKYVSLLFMIFGYLGGNFFIPLP